jgi:hypothetical protein
MSNEITPDNSVCPVYLEPQDPAQVKADLAEAKARQKVQAEKATAKQAVLDKLGLTADEVAALLS